MRGGQWQALRLHRGLLERGHESLLMARDESPLLTAALRAELPCDVLSPLALRRMSRSFNLVHAHDARSHATGALWSRAPLVVSRRVAFPIRDSALSRWKYRRPRLFLAVSRYVSEQLMKGGIEQSRIAVVYDGVPVPPMPAAGNSVIVPYSEDPRKGMALAEEGARLAGIPIRTSENLDEDLARARALVYLTHSEGLGSGILLGMAHGVTVIASRVAGIPELIEDGVNGILVENDAAAVAEAFKRIDPALGLAARETVIARFTEDRMIDATIAAYERILAHA